MIGTEIQNYRIIEKIGEGGMATVYKAAHKTLPNMYRAIKILNPAFSYDPIIRAKFLTEARTLASLDHPNIVKIYDYIEHNGQLILIMEYVPGETLDKLIQFKTGPINEERAKILFLQIIDAISYAHKHGLIHRDIKPSNIIIANDGTVKIIDFGIVKILEDEQSPGATKTGTKIGTPIYMSPEQIKAYSVDERTDIYAMGVTLFQMVTGQSPYEHTLSEFDIQTEIVNEPLPKANTIYPVVSDHIQNIIDKATAKKKEERFKNCEELKEAILHPDKITKQQSIPDKNSIPLKNKKNNKIAAISGIIVSLLLIIVVAIVINKRLQDIKESNNYYLRGKQSFDLSNFTDAIDNFTKAIDLYSSNELALRERGRIKFKMNKNDDAIIDLDKAISLNNNDDTAYNARGIAKKNLEKYDESILDFNKAIEINRNFSWAYNNRGNSKLNLKQFELSILDFDTAINLDGSYKDPISNRAFANFCLKNYQSAIYDYNKW